MKPKLRKKLSMTIIGLIVNWIGVYLASKGIDLTPEQQMGLYEFGTATSGLIIMAFNIGQGIADKGKEVVKTLLIFVMVGSLVCIGVPAYADDTTESIAVESRVECPVIPECQDCEKVCKSKCGWVVLVKDKTFMSAAIGSTLLLIGGIAGIFLVPK